MADEEIDVRVRLKESRKFSRDTAQAAEDIEELGDSLERANKRAVQAGIGFQVLTRGLLAFAKLTAIVALIGVIGGGLAVLVGALGAVLGALGPVTAGFLALPAAMGAAAQGMLVFKFAMSGVGDALGGLNEQIDPEKFAALNREAQRFVLFLDAFKRPLRDLQSDLQGALFPGLAAGISAASANLGVLRAGLPLTGQVIGGLATQLGGLVGSASFGRDLGAILQTNATWIGMMGRTLITLADAFRHVLIVATPFITWMAVGIETWAQGRLEAAQLGRETGRMATFFDKAQNVMGIVVRTGGHLWRMLINIGRAGSGLGTDLLVSLERTSEAFARWTGSREGQARLIQFFENIREPTYEIFKLVSALTAAFFRLGELPGLAGVIAALRTDLLPVLMEFITLATVSFGPVMIDAITNILSLVAAISTGAGPLVLFVMILGEAAGFLAMIIRFTGPLGTMVFTILALGAALKLMALTMRFVGAITGLTTLITLFKAYRAGTLAATAAQLGFNVALWTSPITWVIVGIVALAAGFYLLYTRVEGFRNAVNATWDWIKNNWPLLLGILTGPIGLAVVAIVSKWDAIKEGFGAAVDWIRDKWNGLIDWILEKLDWLPGPVKSFLGIDTNPFAAQEHQAAMAGVRSSVTGEPAPMLKAPYLRQVPVSAPEAGEGEGYRPVIQTTAKVYLDKRQIAEAVAEHNDDEEARS